MLPPRDMFSSPERFERLSGPLKWNRQQGLYIYRANRLVQYGGWNGLRGIDEHTKLARASIDFDTELDETFQINVAKMSVVLPATLKNMLERPSTSSVSAQMRPTVKRPRPASPAGTQQVGFSRRCGAPRGGRRLEGGAVGVGELDGFRVALEKLKERHPELARSLDL